MPFGVRLRTQVCHGCRFSMWFLCSADVWCSCAEGVMIWKYGVTNINNATDKAWISVTDTTWTQIIKPYAQKISAYSPNVAKCKPGAQTEQMAHERSQSCLRPVLAGATPPYVERHHSVTD